MSSQAETIITEAWSTSSDERAWSGTTKQLDPVFGKEGDDRYISDGDRAQIGILASYVSNIIIKPEYH